MKNTTKLRRPKRSSPSSGSAIGVYVRYPDDEIKRCIEEVRDQIPAWFAANPKRKICKVDLFYGRSIDLRRETFSERLDAELAALLSQNSVIKPTSEKA